MKSLPRKLGKYQLREQIGRGNMATVYLGHDSFAQRDVAIKVCDANPPDGIDAELYRKMFFNEAHAAGLLKHPNIVEVFDAVYDDDGYYLVMEYVKGGKTLADFCQIDKLLPIEQTVGIVFKCAAALDYAHRQGVVHRDVKPSNILLNEAMDTKLSDFGIAQFTNAEGTVIKDLVGSPRYMSPEQVEGLEISGRTDIYSLGVVFYELLTGRPIFNADNLPAMLYKIVNDEPVSARDLRGSIPVLVEKILNRMLRRNQRHRYKTCLDVAADLSLAFERLKIPKEQVLEQEKFDLAKRLLFFDDFPNAMIWEFIRASVWRRFQPGEQIVGEGDIDRSLYILAMGEAEASKRGRILNALGAGDCFGEIGYVTKGKRTVDIVAKTDVLVIKIKDTMLDRASAECQLLFHRVFLRTVIERLVQIGDDYSIFSSSDT